MTPSFSPSTPPTSSGSGDLSISPGSGSSPLSTNPISVVFSNSVPPRPVTPPTETHQISPITTRTPSAENLVNQLSLDTTEAELKTIHDTAKELGISEQFDEALLKRALYEYSKKVMDIASPNIQTNNLVTLATKAFINKNFAEELNRKVMEIIDAENDLASRQSEENLRGPD